MPTPRQRRVATQPARARPASAWLLPSITPTPRPSRGSGRTPSSPRAWSSRPPRATAVLDAANDGGKTGVGVSVAANVILKTVHAEIEDGATLTDAGRFKVHADSANAFTTAAKTGSQGDTAFGIGAAVFYAKDDVL